MNDPLPNVDEVEVGLVDRDHDGNVDRLIMEVGPSSDRVTFAVNVDDVVPMGTARSMVAEWQRQVDNAPNRQEYNRLNGAEMYQAVQDDRTLSGAEKAVMGRRLQTDINGKLDAVGSDQSIGYVTPWNISVSF